MDEQWLSVCAMCVRPLHSDYRKLFPEFCLFRQKCVYILLLQHSFGWSAAHVMKEIKQQQQQHMINWFSQRYFRVMAVYQSIHFIEEILMEFLVHYFGSSKATVDLWLWLWILNCYFSVNWNQLFSNENRLLAFESICWINKINLCTAIRTFFCGVDESNEEHANTFHLQK